MPSKKKMTKAAQLQPQPAQSDYDTDTANVTDTAAPMMTPPPARTNTELNLLVLRRYIPDIERIISIAPFAVVYLFSPETQQWEKSGVEGTLFVCQLSAAESGYQRYNVVILNRKSLDNFVMELVSREDIEITEQYVILQVLSEDGTPNIYGLWIFSDEDSVLSTREVVAGAIQECAVRAEHGRANAGEAERQNGHAHVPEYNLDGVAEPEPEPEPEPAMDQTSTSMEPQQAGQQIDLLSLFSKPRAPGYQQAPEQERATSHPTPQQPQPQPTRFSSTADTDFFRNSHSPAVGQQQRAPPPAQQNPLLDLFKNEKKG